MQYCCNAANVADIANIAIKKHYIVELELQKSAKTERKCAELIKSRGQQFSKDLLAVCLLEHF